MGFFDQAFIDLRALLGFSPDEVIEIDHARARQIEAACAAGGVLYFAPGKYLLRPGNLDLPSWVGDLTIPATVTAWFDPGAIIQLRASRLVLDGGVEAPLAQIFEEISGGMAIFGGAPDALRPEWWGARGDGQRDDTAAIQAAIDAGSARRMPRSAGSRTFRRPIPISFQGIYAVTRGLVLGRAVNSPLAPRADAQARRCIVDFGQSGLIATRLEGARIASIGPSAGIVAHPDGFTGEDGALLVLDRANGAQVIDLAFDGRLRAEVGLSVSTGQRDDSVHSVSVGGCRFRGARRTQVQIGPPRARTPGVKAPFPVAETVITPEGLRTQPGITPFTNPVVSAPIDQVPAGVGDAAGVSLGRCTFECNLTEPIGALTLDGTPPRGVLVRVANAVNAYIAASRFRGAASAFIEVDAGMVLIERCRFDNAHEGIKKSLDPSRLGASGVGAADRMRALIERRRSHRRGRVPARSSPPAHSSQTTDRSD